MKKLITLVISILLSIVCIAQPIETWIENTRSCPNDDIIVTIRVKNFNNVSAISLKMNYPNGLLTYNGIEYKAISGMLINQSGNLILAATYTLNTYNLPDSAILFSLKFHHNYSDFCNIVWDTCEYNDSYGFTIPSIFYDGKIFNQHIIGNIKYYNIANTPMINMQIYLYRNGILYDSTLTNSFGNYDFSCFENGIYDIKLKGLWGGVDATDALIIAKHTVCIITITDSLCLLAGDVNCNGWLNATDSFFIMKRMTGYINSFPLKDWIYLPISPIIVNQINTNNIIVNLTVLCAGDVNRSYIP